jgi:hypothetical protein
VKKSTVSTPEELLAALDRGSRDIQIVGVLEGMPSLRLPAGFSLSGGRLVFGARGLILSGDNKLWDIEIDCPAHEIAIGNATTVDDLGILSLRHVRTRGQVFLTATDSVRRGTVAIEDLHVTEADLRGRERRPHGYGVDVLQGAITIWNLQEDTDSVLKVEAWGLSAGSADTPIRGSGVFVGGRCDDSGHSNGGTVAVSLLETGTVVIDGGIPFGTPDLISGGVFVQAGANVDSVANRGPTTTLGSNDMALDNWGRVTRWTTMAPVVTRGSSGIGFVNFGDLDQLDVKASIETYGLGARGFNLYDGTLARASFESIATHGDGAVGIQVAKPLPELTVRTNVTTGGGVGTSLVRGHQIELPAIALSIKEGGHIDRLRVTGDIRTTGDSVVSLELLGTVDRLEVGGRVIAEGQGSDGAHVAPNVAAQMEQIGVFASGGRAVVEASA